MFGDPGPAEFLLGALLLLRLVEFWRTRAAPDRDSSPARPLFHAGWLAGLVILATDGGTVWAAGAALAVALILWRAIRLVRGAHDVPVVATLAETLVMPLAFGLWPYAIVGTAIFAALALRRGG